MYQVLASRVKQDFGPKCHNIDSTAVIPADWSVVEQISRGGGHAFGLKAGERRLCVGDKEVVYNLGYDQFVFVYPSLQHPNLSLAEQRLRVEQPLIILGAATIVALCEELGRAFWSGRVRTPDRTDVKEDGRFLLHSFTPCAENVLRPDHVSGIRRMSGVGVLVGLVVPMPVSGRIPVTTSLQSASVAA